MYLSDEDILRSIGTLNRVHPFLGITFLACKKFELPVGRTAQISVDGLTKRHMDEYHRLSPDS